MRRRTALLLHAVAACALALTWPVSAAAEAEHAARLANAAAVLEAFTSDEAGGIPIQLLARAHGVAVIPNLIRGGFILGGRRGRGVITVRTPDGQFANPAMITLTGGSIGWQLGAEAGDLVLVFANERSIRNIESGKFTLGGDASAVAGPVGRRQTAALTGKAEVYAYFRSRGLFAGAAFEGARLDVDQQGTARYYAADPRAQAFSAANAATPAAARHFLEALQRASTLPAPPSPSRSPSSSEPRPEGARTFPLEDAPARNVR